METKEEQTEGVFYFSSQDDKKGKKETAPCSNCNRYVKKGIRLCPYCGHLNPTLKVKDIIIASIALLIIFYIVINFVNI